MVDKEEFINRSKEIHGDKYDYSKVTFNKVTDKVKIICPIHGEFDQVARQHYRGQGCPKCAVEERAIKKSDTTESFIEKAKKIYGDKYDYSKVNYIDSLTNVTIICSKHGEFEKRPDGFLQGHGCPICGKLLGDEKNTMSKEVFVEKMKNLYGNKYDYSNIEYVNSKTKITLVCSEHGEFKRTPYKLLKGYDCQKCIKNETIKKRTKTLEQFVDDAKKIHGDKYDYRQVKYVDIFTPVDIICSQHGMFKQIPTYHLSGCGCSKCWNNSSHSEEEIFNFIKENYDGPIEKDNRTVLKNLNQSLDIYLPEKNIAFEFDGLYWHNEYNKPDKKYHLNKTEECLKNNIQLIHIFEDEWLFKREICKSRINSLLNLNTNKIYARKCELKEIDNKTSKDFCEKNNIQGCINSKISLGLFYDNELVSVMTFGKLRKNLGSVHSEDSYELLRFCNKLNTTIAGGASKLFKYFINKYKPAKVISYCDRRWSNGDFYQKIGFNLTHKSQPNYFYVFGNNRKNRFNYRKDILIKKYGCPEDMSEHEFCLSKKWYRIYDCGCFVFEWR